MAKLGTEYADLINRNIDETLLEEKEVKSYWRKNRRGLKRDNLDFLMVEDDPEKEAEDIVDKYTSFLFGTDEDGIATQCVELAKQKKYKVIIKVFDKLNHEDQAQTAVYMLDKMKEADIKGLADELKQKLRNIITTYKEELDSDEQKKAEQFNGFLNVIKPQTPTATTKTVTLTAKKVSVDIKESVGEDLNKSKAKNRRSDVKQVQDQLLYLGYLSQENYTKEKADTVKPDELIKQENLKATIVAIKLFQTTVLSQKKPNGNISPGGNTEEYLNTAVKIPTEAESDEIDKMRAEFQVTTLNVEAEIKGLAGPVGATIGNAPDDLKKIQSALIKLGYLSADDLKEKKDKKSTVTKPAETADKIKEFYKYKAEEINIKKEHIPITIKAIEKVQTKLNVDFFKKKGLLTAKEYTSQVVKPDDATFEVLKEYKKYTINYKSIDDKTNKSFTTSNYQKSGDTKYIEGVGSLGKQNSSLGDLKDFEDMGLSSKLAKCLMYVSTHEGKFDAVNTYDQAVFSYGFIQFAGGGRGLPPMMAYIKYNKPDAFKTRFQKYGIDVEYRMNANQKVTEAHLVIIDSTGKSLRGSDAESYIQKNVSLLGVFIKAAEDADIQKGQVIAAIKDYVNLAISTKLDISHKYLVVYDKDKKKILATYYDRDVIVYKAKEEYKALLKEKLVEEGTVSLTETLPEYLVSEKTQAAMIGIRINEGNTKAVTRAIDKLILEKKLITSDQVKKFDELEKLEYIKNEVKKPHRVQDIIDTDKLSSTE
ncbi:MAG TPA: hypothetical protein VNB90_01710 [Cytophagaceae bacterium]|nr:hypothetical protein [Cytophagaceae bacterium]